MKNIERLSMRLHSTEFQDAAVIKINELIEKINDQQKEIDQLKQSQNALNIRTSGLMVVGSALS